MAQASVTFSLGAESVTSILDIDLDVVIPISGSFAGTIAAGEHAHITGDVNLTGDLIVEGLLTGIDTFTLTGNGFQLLAQDGGKFDLAGVQKSGWVRWGEPVIGWQIGDRLGVAPTAPGYLPFETIWQGSWAATSRPVSSQDLTLPGGKIAKPEVSNLSQTIVLKNLRRIHFHNGAGVQTLKWLKVLNSGTVNVLAEYPIHFHLCGETVRGSLLEGVVVEGGKNHAFVPHGSHGITFRDCVAYNTTNHAYWYDAPTSSGHVANNPNDLIYQHCLANKVNVPPGNNGFQIAGFVLSAGHGNKCLDSVVTCDQGTVNSGGFIWPESANNNIGGTVWEFKNNVSHNNLADGIFVWQNDDPVHLIQDFTAYRNKLSGVDHGAYINAYQYKRLVLMGGNDGRFRLHSLSLDGQPELLEDVTADGTLVVEKHSLPSSEWFIVRRCLFTSVRYLETSNGGVIASKGRFEDCGFTPAKFDLVGIRAGSIIEVYEAGVLTHRWAGAWT